MSKELGYTMIFDGSPSTATSTLQNIFKHARDRMMRDNEYHHAAIIEKATNKIVLIIDTYTFKAQG